MVTRLRPALGALAAAALLAFGLSLATSDDAAAPRDKHEAVALAVAKASPARSATPTRAPRPAVLPLLGLAGLLAVAAAGATRAPTLIGRHRRRPVDDGDDWRSLLLGAPPGLA